MSTDDPATDQVPFNRHDPVWPAGVAGRYVSIVGVVLAVACQDITEPAAPDASLAPAPVAFTASVTELADLRERSLLALEESDRAAFSAAVAGLEAAVAARSEPRLLLAVDALRLAATALPDAERAAMELTIEHVTLSTTPQSSLND